VKTKKTTPNFKASENDPNKIIPYTEHPCEFIYMIKNGPGMLGASFVGIALARFFDGLISIFDNIKGQGDMALFSSFFFIN
jgi:hypothetical protein